MAIGIGADADAEDWCRATATGDGDERSCLVGQTVSAIVDAFGFRTRSDGSAYVDMRDRIKVKTFQRETISYE